MSELRFRQVHLDFHTSERIPNVGENFDPDAFAEMLVKAEVNSITCFARCHHGMIYYDTRFPAKHPALKRDLLREQIRACHARGIKVPIYITVGWDEYMASRHPEWLERTPDGRPYGAGPLEAGWRSLCFNTPYVDYVEEQTIEVLELFGSEVDGLFFDIIHQHPCCCSFCLAGMEKAGLDASDEDQRSQYAAEVLRRFQERMTAAVRRHNQECSIFYNSGHVGPEIRRTLHTYTHLELESLPSGGWGYEHFPITVRYAKNLGKPYLGMTGKFHKSWADFGGFKNQAALEYECFMALANGAKCSIGDQLHPSGEMNAATYDLIGAVYRSVKEKEAWCEGTQAISEIAVFNPEVVAGGPERIHPSLAGAYRMLIEADYQFDVIDQHAEFARYALIIFPDQVVMNDALRSQVEAYLAHGGRILLSHRSGLSEDQSRFALEQVGWRLCRPAEFSPDYLRAEPLLQDGMADTEYVMYDRALWVEPGPGAVSLARILNPYFNRRFDHFCSHRQTPVANDSGYPAIVQDGNIIYFAHPIFAMYHQHGARVYKQLVVNCLERLLPDKVVRTNAPSTAQLNLNYQADQDRYVLHILHYIPERRFVELDTIEDVIPLYNIEVSVKLPRPPKECYTAPSKTSLEYGYRDGRVMVTVPKVHGHQMVVFA